MFQVVLSHTCLGGKQQGILLVLRWNLIQLSNVNDSEKVVERVVSMSTLDQREQGVDLTRHIPPAERLAMLEQLRRDTFKLLGREYPSRIQRVFEIVDRGEG